MRHAVNSYLLTASQFQRLVTEDLRSVLGPLEPVDSLHGYTARMFEILVDWLASEGNISLSGARGVVPDVVLRDGSVVSHDGSQAAACMTRHDARVLRTRLDKRPWLVNGDLFDCYDYACEDGHMVGRAGFDFLRRQADHFRSADEYLLVVVTPTPVEGRDFRL